MLLSNSRFSFSHDSLSIDGTDYAAFDNVGSYTSEYSCLATLSFDNNNKDNLIRDIVPEDYNFFDFTYNAVFNFDSLDEKLSAYLNIAGHYVKFNKQ